MFAGPCDDVRREFRAIGSGRRDHGAWLRHRLAHFWMKSLLHWKQAQSVEASRQLPAGLRLIRPDYREKLRSELHVGVDAGPQIQQVPPNVTFGGTLASPSEVQPSRRSRLKPRRR